MQEQKMKWQCRYAPSLGALERPHEEVWGTKHYISDESPTVFFGLYGMNDFYSLWRHKGRKCILWAGSDITHFVRGYWLDDKGHIRIDPLPLAEWINKNCESYVENGVEAETLRVLGIESTIIPSFLGNVEDYKVSYKPEYRPKVYASVSGDNFELYGWDVIERIAPKCNVDFYLYGNVADWQSKHGNVFVRGRVPKDVMNEEIKDMQCGLRVLSFDGFSEVLAKSVLWGQYPISKIGYPHIDSYKTDAELIDLLNDLKNRKEPNLKARDYYLKNLNKYPWVTK